jgi:hypothetical protein
MWFSSLFANICVPQMKSNVIYDGNQSYLSLSKNLIFHVRMKHIEIYHHLGDKKLKNVFFKLVYWNTKNIVANILTKGLFVDKHEYF